MGLKIEGLQNLQIPIRTSIILISKSQPPTKSH